MTTTTNSGSAMRRAQSFRRDTLKHDLLAGETSFVTASSFEAWVTRARPGDQVIYALGSMLQDIHNPGGVLLYETRKRALICSNYHEVHLKQKKLADGCYEYIAERTAEARRPGK